jgi:hypothetical protein
MLIPLPLSRCQALIPRAPALFPMFSIVSAPAPVADYFSPIAILELRIEHRHSAPELMPSNTSITSLLQEFRF